MARCELRVSCVNIKKISKIKNISQFGLEPNVREKERGGRKKKQASTTILRGFASRNSTGRELKLLYATRDMRGYRNHKISPGPGLGFHRNREKAVSQEIMLF